MKNTPLILLSAFLAIPALADEPAADAPATPPAAAGKYEKPSYSISLKQFPLIAKKDNSANGAVAGGRAIRALQSKKTSYQMKWASSVRVRGTRPDQLEMEVYYIGQNADNEWIQIGETQKETVTLDNKGVWNMELLSPVTEWTETKQQKPRGNTAQTADTPEKQGERIKGCIIHLLADGKLVKSHATDPRWKKASEKETFDIADIDQRKSKIGVR